MGGWLLGPELLLVLDGQISIIPIGSLFLPSLAKALLQLDIPSFEMLILSFTKDGPVLGVQLYVDWRLNRHSFSATAWSSADQTGHWLALKNILSFLSSLGENGLGNRLAPFSPGPSSVPLTPGLSEQGPGRIFSCHRIVQKPGSSGYWERLIEDWEAAYSLQAPGQDSQCGGVSPHSPAIEHVGPPSLPQGPDYKYGASGCGARRVQDGGQCVPDPLLGGGGWRAPWPVRGRRGGTRVAALHRGHPQPYGWVQGLAARAAAPTRLPADTRRGLRHRVSPDGGQDPGGAEQARPGPPDCRTRAGHVGTAASPDGTGQGRDARVWNGVCRSRAGRAGKAGRVGEADERKAPRPSWEWGCGHSGWGRLARPSSARTGLWGQSDLSSDSGSIFVLGVMALSGVNN